jgi:predicted NBD/HSP70 family sugar kinase
VGGEILGETNVAGHGTTGEKSLAMVAGLIQKLMRIPAERGLRVGGIAIGAPGITLEREGVVVWAPSLNWSNFPLKQRLQERFSVPITVENDVNLAALGEHWFGAGQGTRSMVLIAIGTGVGSGLIIDGALYRGQNCSAGEVGYLIPGREALGITYDGFGALESIISGTGIARRAQNALAGRLGPAELAEVNSPAVFEAARRREAWACRVVDETVDYLSIAIGNISAILAPELCVLGGGVAHSADLLIEPVIRRLTGVVPYIPRIEASTLGYRGAVMGGIATIVYATTDYVVARRLS